MIAKKSVAACLTFFILLFNFEEGTPCSSYKITLDGKTMMGSNYDSWLESPVIWFETNNYGAVFTGARPDGKSGIAPQAGMNEFGLGFITLATATPSNGAPSPGKKPIANRTDFLKNILHTCKTVDEVRASIDQYDHSTLSEEVLLFVDKSGKYLIVEPYTMSAGNDSTYVLSNFCPSTITDFSTIKQRRYINGTAFLKNKIDTSVSFCTSLSDTMHVCREKLGDGTLLTSIWDLNDGVTYLYFYHDYNNRVKFNLKDELAKGDHSVAIEPLFPPNAEYKKLVHFKTPNNSPAIDLFLRSCVFLFFISAIFFFISYFRKRKTTRYAYIKLLMVLLSLIMMFYMFVLARTENIFYFPAPYTDGSFSVVSVAAYIPFLILLLIIPLLFINRKIFRDSNWSVIPKWIFTLNNVAYLALIVLFSYWGLYNVFN